MPNVRRRTRLRGRGIKQVYFLRARETVSPAGPEKAENRAGACPDEINIAAGRIFSSCLILRKPA